MKQSKNREKLDGVSFFLDELDLEMRAVIKENPTKQVMLASMSAWLNYINTIKGIVE